MGIENAEHPLVALRQSLKSMILGAEPSYTVSDERLHRALEADHTETFKILLLAYSQSRDKLSPSSDQGRQIWRYSLSWAMEYDPMTYRRVLHQVAEEYRGWGLRTLDYAASLLIGLTGYPYFYYSPDKLDEAMDKLSNVTDRIFMRQALRDCKRDLGLSTSYSR